MWPLSGFGHEKLKKIIVEKIDGGHQMVARCIWSRKKKERKNKIK
jgi:hypothetical protein